jgi:hypothetical protein
MVYEIGIVQFFVTPHMNSQDMHATIFNFVRRVVMKVFLTDHSDEK